MTEEAVEALSDGIRLAGTLARPDGRPRAVAVVVPGSGPTDRDGNNPLGVAARPYRLLAEGLSAAGIATLRSDKRGLFGSAAEGLDADDVRVKDYVRDTLAWVAVARQRTGADCAWLMGHSEGGVFALLAARAEPDAVCGVILLAAPGRRLGEVLREQLRANPANAAILPDALAAIDRLEAGNPVDTAGFHPSLAALFRPGVQAYLIDLMRRDPAAEAAALLQPLLIVEGGADIQVGAVDAEALASAKPDATRLTLPGMNHVLKTVPPGDMAANLAAYGDPALPLDPGLVPGIVSFIAAQR